MKVIVMVNTIEKVKRFVSICNRYTSLDIDATQARYVIDAKSIMGVFSLDLSKKFGLTIYEDTQDDITKFLEEIDEFVIKDDAYE